MRECCECMRAVLRFPRHWAAEYRRPVLPSRRPLRRGILRELLQASTLSQFKCRGLYVCSASSTTTRAIPAAATSATL